MEYVKLSISEGLFSNLDKVEKTLNRVEDFFHTAKYSAPNVEDSYEVVAIWRKGLITFVMLRIHFSHTSREELMEYLSI